MKIFLCNFDDTTGPARFTALQGILPNTNGLLTNFGGTRDLKSSWESVFTAASADVVLALVHVSKLPLTKIVEFANGSPLPEKLALVLFSGGGVAEAAVSDSELDGSIFCHHSVNHNVLLYRPSFSGGLPQDILDAVIAFAENRFPDFIRSFSLAKRERQLAFRLLCEARSACGDKASTTLRGVTIHAPVNLEQWLAPFSPKGNNDNERIAAVVSIMGDMEGKAKDVLDAVNKTPCDNAGMLNAVNAFLGNAEA